MYVGVLDQTEDLLIFIIISKMTTIAVNVVPDMPTHKCKREKGDKEKKKYSNQAERCLETKQDEY